MTKHKAVTWNISGKGNAPPHCPDHPDAGVIKHTEPQQHPDFVWPKRTRRYLGAAEQARKAQMEARLSALNAELATLQRERHHLLYGPLPVWYFTVPAFPWPGNYSDDVGRTDAAVLLHAPYDAELVAIAASFFAEHGARPDWIGQPTRAMWVRSAKVWAIEPVLWPKLADALRTRLDVTLVEIPPPLSFSAYTLSHGALRAL